MKRYPEPWSAEHERDEDEYQRDFENRWSAMNLTNKWELKNVRLLKIIENLKRRLDDCDMRIHSVRDPIAKVHLTILACQEVTHPKICDTCQHLEIEHYTDGEGTTGCDGQIFEGGTLYDCHCIKYEKQTKTNA